MEEVDVVSTIAPEENIWQIGKRLRTSRFDVAIVFPNSLRTALEPWLARIPRRVGYPGHRRRWLLNQVFKARHKRIAAPPRHHTAHYLALANFIGADVPPAAPAPLLHDRQGPLVLGLCPGAEYGPAKRWLPERFAEVMVQIAGRHPCLWKLFGVKNDRPIADRLLAMTKEVATVDFVGRTSLAELIRELQTCRLLVTNDTGTMHLAAHFGVPTIPIFGSTEPALTGPLGAEHRILRHHVECSPCFLRECPLDFRCMHAIEPAEVVDAVENVLRARNDVAHLSA
jgi:lipopolysaccharide heptosyltransferase II